MSINRGLFYFGIALAFILLCLPQFVIAAEKITSNQDVSLFVNGKKLADTWVKSTQDGNTLEAPWSPVLFALNPLLNKQVLARLEAQFDPNGVVSNRTLSKLGIGMIFDSELRRLILVPPFDINDPNPEPFSFKNRNRATGEKLTKKEIEKKQREITETKERVLLEENGEGSGQIERDAQPNSQDFSGPWTTPPTPDLQNAQIKETKNDSAKNGGRGWAGTIPKIDTVNIPGLDLNGLRLDSTKLDGVAFGRNDGKPGSGVSPSVGSNDSVSRQENNTKVVFHSVEMDKTRDELFEQIFNKKPPPLPDRVEVTLLIDEKPYGSLWAQYDHPQKRYYFETVLILNSFKGLVREDVWQNVSLEAKNEGRFSEERLTSLGFPTILNTSKFELGITIPAELIGIKIHPLSGQVLDPYTVPAYKPAPISAYLNARIKRRFQHYQYGPTPYDTTGFGKRYVENRNKQPHEPLSATFDGAANIKTWVIEGRAVLWEKQFKEYLVLNREDIRLVHDWPKQAWRLNVGDLIFPTTGYQQFLNMGGVGFSRDFSLQPHLPAYPVKDYEFFLTNPAEVKVFINGGLRGIYQLDQGPHNFQGFPFTTGESEVEIQIVDNTGVSQTINFNFIHEPTLLAKGKSAFSYNLGFPSRSLAYTDHFKYKPYGLELGNYEYDMAHPTLFLDYKRGITDKITLEGYSQALDTAGVVGATYIQTLKFGKIKSDFAGSYFKGKSPSIAGNIEYAYIPKLSIKSSPTGWRLKTEYLGPTFYRPGQDRSLLGSFSVAGYYQRNNKLANLTVGGGYTIRPDSNNLYNVSLNLGHYWKRGFSSTLFIKNSFDRNRSTFTTISANVSYVFNLDNQFVAASQRVEKHQQDINERGSPPDWDYSTDLSWDYNSFSPFPNNPILNASTSFNPINNEYTGKAQWKGNQGYAEILGRRQEPKKASTISNYADVALHSGLVFADGNFALSRPVNNGFVMVKGIENEKKCEILVNPNQSGYDAKSAQYLPGVIPNLSPYYLKKIHIEVKDPPIGSNDDTTDFTLYPEYKSGYVIYMGTKATVIVLGTLLIAPGVPADYQTFKATALTSKTQQPFVGFTNRAGKFQMMRLEPDNYKIEMDVNGSPYSTILTMSKNAEGILVAGTLLLAPK